MPDLALPCLCLVTDRNQCKSRPLEEVVALAVDGGVNMVQLREKDLKASELLPLAIRLRDICKGKALLFINDSLDVALACGADGVQLGEDAVSVAEARSVAGDRILIGSSVHDVEKAIQAEADGADLLIVGTIFPTGSHPEASPAGVIFLEDVHDKVTVPFIGIGGVKESNVEDVIKARASGAAVISAIVASDEPRDAARSIANKMAHAWSARTQTGVKDSK